MLPAGASPLLITVFSVAILLQSLSPASVLYTLTFALGIHLAPAMDGTPAEFLAFSETAFAGFMAVFLSLAGRQRTAGPATPVPLRGPEIDAEARYRLWQRCITDATIDPANLTVAWTRPENGDFYKVRRGDVEEWICWGILGKVPGELTGSEALELERYVLRLEEATRHRFPPGRSSESKVMRTTVAPLNVLSRPLLGYVLTDAIVGKMVTPSVLASMGFTSAKAGAVKYFYWEPPRAASLASAGPAPGSRAEGATADEDQPPGPPIVFIHGVGIGPISYSRFLVELQALGRPIYAVDLPFVSQRVALSVPDEDAWVDGVKAMLAQRAHSKATFVGHSLGTAYTAYVVRRRPELVAGLVFIDPVCFLMHHPDITQQMVFRDPTSLAEYVEDFLVRSEPFTTIALQRHVWWYRANLWLEDLPPGVPTSVVVSSKDSIVPAAALERYFTSWQARSRVNAVILRGLPHGGFLLDATERRRIVAAVAASPSPKTLLRSSLSRSLRVQVMSPIMDLQRGVVVEAGRLQEELVNTTLALREGIGARIGTGGALGAAEARGVAVEPKRVEELAAQMDRLRSSLADSTATVDQRRGSGLNISFISSFADAQRRAVKLVDDLMERELMPVAKNSLPCPSRRMRTGSRSRPPGSAADDALVVALVEAWITAERLLQAATDLQSAADQVSWLEVQQWLPRPSLRKTPAEPAPIKRALGALLAGGQLSPVLSERSRRVAENRRKRLVRRFVEDFTRRASTRVTQGSALLSDATNITALASAASQAVERAASQVPR